MSIIPHALSSVNPIVAKAAMNMRINFALKKIRLTVDVSGGMYLIGFCWPSGHTRQLPGYDLTERGKRVETARVSTY